MQAYTPPIEDYRFLLTKVLGFDAEMAELNCDIEVELAAAVLEEGGRFCRDVLQPINRSGDEIGSRLIDGEVVTPAGFPAAYRAFAEGGWTALTADPSHGGQGLPFILQLWLDEMIAATNLSFGLFPGLTRGAVEALTAHGSDALKAIYLHRMVSGEWTGAMALTEGGAGTDLALLKTRARPLGDGSYAITGQKIFISSGDHDFGGNVVHLVLARLADAPDGIKGVSLFLVPKYLPDEAGEPKVRNSMSVGSLEEKMGIHAQPTCVMNYDDAVGWLVGTPHKGVAAMFTMMNAERLMVGIQGLGIAGAAYQQAVGYAKDRLQGRATGNAHGAVAIIEHAEVRRMLLDVRVFVEGARALAGWTALQLDRAQKHPAALERKRSGDFVALLTPVVKAAFTDFGFESAVTAQQVFGGHGYIREWGMEQFVRDARIAQIYEGTNGVQAIDLVGRKLAMAGGQVAIEFLALVEGELAASAEFPQAATCARATTAALAHLRRATDSLIGADVDQLGAAATAYLKLFAIVCLGWMWTRQVAVELDDSALEKSKVKLAAYFATRVSPQAAALADAVTAGTAWVTALTAEDF